jgi:hypothetical protein
MVELRCDGGSGPVGASAALPMVRGNRDGMGQGFDVALELALRVATTAAPGSSTIEP